VGGANCTPKIWAHLGSVAHFLVFEIFEFRAPEGQLPIFEFLGFRVFGNWSAPKGSGSVRLAPYVGDRIPWVGDGLLASRGWVREP